MMMDRLPLVRALTQAGLERTGAENVAIGEAIESSVVTKGDLAREVSRLEGVIGSESGSQRGEIHRLELAMQAMETRLTLRLGGILVAAMGALLAIQRFVSHAP